MSKSLTYENIIRIGVQIKNAVISKVSLNMKDYGCLVLDITLKGDTWGCRYGGNYFLGKGYLGASDECFKGYDKGTEAIMRIMNVVGVEDLYDMIGKCVRVAIENGEVIAIGHFLNDKWFDYKLFFEDTE